MNENFQLYKNLIENNHNGKYEKLWDLVIISSINQKQKECYEKQIEIKLKSGKLPTQFIYKVLNDPDDCKIGSGGSTLNIFKKLYDEYNEKLFDMKIMLIHAGGYCQRMPTCTVLGKIFGGLACKSDYINDMLDINIAIYTPFSLNMKPGIFLISSDIFITFKFNEQIISSNMFGSNDNDVVLISHKSNLTIAKDHGVYVVDSKCNVQSEIDAYNCKFVLQKPSIQKMKDLNIVLKDDKTNEEFVYTDSVFYLSNRLMKSLLNYHDTYFDQVIANKIEIDAYRDFLQPLGTEPLSLNEYFSSAKIDKNNKIHTEIFEKLYLIFLNRNSIVLSLTDSDFYHLGTVNELLDLYLNDESPISNKFRKFSNFTNLKIKKEWINNFNDNRLKNVIINSKISSNICDFNEKSLIEYCFIDNDIDLTVNEFCYLNNCMLLKKDLNPSNITLNIPANICMHTVPVISNERHSKYVTIFFNRNDDLKKEYKDVESIIFLGETIPNKFSKSIRFTNQNSYSIWNLKIFKAFNTMTDSFVNSLKFINDYLSLKVENRTESDLDIDLGFNDDFYSLFDILRLNQYESMLSFRANYDMI